MKLIWSASLCLVWLATSVLATAPSVSLRPEARPGGDARAAVRESLRPVPRPLSAHSAEIEEIVRQVVADRSANAPLPRGDGKRRFAFASSPVRAIPASLRPALRPARFVPPRHDAPAGALCGDPALQGETVGRVPGRLPGCGVKNAVRVRSVSGVRLSQAAVIDCTTARSLKSWIDGSLKREIGRRGGGVREIRILSHYSCRTRNSRPGAKISEHGKGRAIDVAAFRLRDGSQITVADGWKNRKTRKLLKRLHGSACGVFGTVLGPDSDRYHQDHFHFDTARYRGGPYCR